MSDSSPSETTIDDISQEIDIMIANLQNSIVKIREKQEKLNKENESMLKFAQGTEKYVVGIIDIISSTSICSKLSDEQASSYYQIFLNSMNDVIKKYGGVVSKNIGDSILYYFPIDIKSEKQMLEKCLDCCLALSAEHKFIATRLEERQLPPLDYRISSAYGTVKVAKTSTSDIDDIFGTTVNKCAKLNRSAKPNGIVIGKNFYLVVKDFSNHKFEEIGEKLTSSDFVYSGYHVLS